MNNMLTRALVPFFLLNAVAAAQNAPPDVTAIFEKLYQAVRDNYPMPEYPGFRGDEWFAEFKAKIASAPTREAAFQLMDEFVCRLNDYHTRLFWPGRSDGAAPPIEVQPVLASATMPAGYGIWGRLHPPLELPSFEGVVIAVTKAAEGTGLRPGDEIVSVDGTPAREALARAWHHSVGSSVTGKLRDAARRMLLGPRDSELKLTIRRPGADTELTAAVARSGSLSEDTLRQREIEGIPVIRIVRWTGDGLVTQFDKLLEDLRTSPGIIIDVRGNSGGSDQMAGEVAARFLSAPIIGSISFRRIVPGQTFERTVETIPPRGPWRYEGRFAILTDEACVSACEHFVSAMIEAGALASGTPTSGACGLIRGVDLGAGVRLNVSRTFPLHTGGIPSPQLGIAPHIWAPPLLEDLRNGKDTALAAALAWIKSSDPLPVRLQPIWPLAR